MKNIKIKIEISARHVHLTRKHVQELFGKEYKLKKLQKLSQHGEFSTKDTVKLKIGDKIIKSLRVVGPEREYTQVELSRTDSFKLGINPPVRISGDIKKSVGGFLIGSKGKIELKHGIILAHRHIHASKEQAKKRGLRNGQFVKVKIGGIRAAIFEKVKVKVRDFYEFRMHIDCDEANAVAVDDSNNIGIII